MDFIFYSSLGSQQNWAVSVVIPWDLPLAPYSQHPATEWCVCYSWEPVLTRITRIPFLVVLGYVYFCKKLLLISSLVAILFCFPTNSKQEFLLVCFLVSVWDFGCSNSCVVVSHFCFHLQFPDDIWCWISFFAFFSVVFAFSLVRYLFRSLIHF